MGLRNILPKIRIFLYCGVFICGISAHVSAFASVASPVDDELDMQKLIYDYYRGLGNGFDVVVKYLLLSISARENKLERQSRMAALRKVLAARKLKEDITPDEDDFEKAPVVVEEKPFSHGALEDSLDKAIEVQRDLDRARREKIMPQFSEAVAF